MGVRAMIGPATRSPIEVYGPIAPVSLGTVSVPTSTAAVLVTMINNAALLAVLNIDMPAGAFHGQIVRFTFDKPITVINWTSALGSVLAPLTAALAGSYAAFVWDSVSQYWRRLA